MRKWMLEVFLVPAFLFSAAVSKPPLYLLILMDASGSMKQTDPYEYRKLAAEALLALLPENSQISLVQFGSNPKVLVGWTPVANQGKLRGAIRRVGNNDLYTDFLLALKTAHRLFLEAPDSVRKIVLLLTDGILEPNPNCPEYSPYYLNFKRRTLQKNSARAYRLYQSEFRESFTIVSERKIFQDVIPLLKSTKIQVFTIGFSPKADDKFLEKLTMSTNLKPSEIHHFHANRPIDLTSAFLNMLSYWESIMVLKTDSGVVDIKICSNNRASIPIKSFKPCKSN